MTEFGNYLAGIMSEQGLNAGTFAEKLGIDPGNLSRIYSGAQRQIRGSTLKMIIANATDNVESQAHLLAAYLRDQRVGAGLEMVSVVVTAGKRISPAPAIPTQPGVKELFAIINKNLNKGFIANLLAILTAYTNNKKFERAFNSLAALAKELPKSPIAKA